MSEVIVRDAVAEDYAQWRVLWEGYNSFYAATLEDAITQHTWDRALNPASPVLCRVAQYEGKVVGFALCVLHEGTYHMSPVCYLEDFFVDANLRGRGIGHAVLTALRKEAQEKGWAKVYWFTRETNPARKLYDKEAATDDFVRYTMKM